MPKPAFSHLLIFGFSLEKHEDILKVSTKTLTQKTTLRKKVESFAWALVKKNSHAGWYHLWHLKLYQSKKKTSNAVIKRFADIGSPSRTPIFMWNTK